jgi:hypothetical protein
LNSKAPVMQRSQSRVLQRPEVKGIKTYAFGGII